MNEIQLFTTTGETVYGVLTNGAAYAYRTDTDVFEVKVNGDWAKYALPLTELTTGAYYATLPDALPSSSYTVACYKQLGGSPATTDTFIANATINWTLNNPSIAELVLPGTPTAITITEATAASLQYIGYPTNQGWEATQTVANYANVSVSWTQADAALIDYWLVTIQCGGAFNGQQFKTLTNSTVIPQLYKGWTYTFGVQAHRLHDNQLGPTAYSAPYTIS